MKLKIKLARWICRHAITLLLGISLSLAATAQTPKAMVIGIDGLRPDALERAVQTGLAPNLAGLIDQGTYCRGATTSDRTFSGPGWSDILYGVHRDLHEVTTNSVCGNVFCNSRQASYPDFLAIANQQQPSLQTARWTTWAPLSDTRTPGGSDYNYFRSYTDDGDRRATDNAVDYLTNENPDVCFFYFADVDIAGHTHGFHPAKNAYLAEISSTDALLGRVVDAIKSRSGYQTGAESWLLIVCTDHGGNLGRGHSGNRPWDREVFLIVAGDNVPATTLHHIGKNVDVVPTVLSHMGLSLPSHLAGNVINDLTGPAAPVLGQNLIFNGDAELDHGFPDNSFDQSVTGWNEFSEADFFLEQSLRVGNQSTNVIQYGSSGYPNSSSPGGSQGGQSFFAGGESTTVTSMSQRVDISSMASLIIQGQAEFQMSGLLGGNGSIEDRCQLSARFLDADDNSISQVTLQAVTASDRNDVTGLLPRSLDGLIPRTARKVEFVLSTFGPHGYADNLSFIVREGTGCMQVVCFDDFEDLTLKPFDTDFGIGDGTDYANEIPGWTIDNSEMSSESLEAAYNGVTAMDVDSWIEEQGPQLGRGSTGRFGIGTHNTALVFDADAWADFSSGEDQGFNSRISKTYNLTGRDLNSLRVEFDWEFASENRQRGLVEISFDGGVEWTPLLDLDSNILGNNQLLGEHARFNAGSDFTPTSASMMLRISKVKAGNNWWFMLDNIRISDSQGLIDLENFEGLNMKSFTVANTLQVGDGSDFTDSIPHWTIDNSQMRGTTSEGAYFGWTAMDVGSWMQEQGGQGRSTLATLDENVLLVADPDAWDDYTTGAGSLGFNSFASREIDLRGYQRDSVILSLDYEFRVFGSQRGTIEISFDGGHQFTPLLDFDSLRGPYNDNETLSGTAVFLAGDDFEVTSDTALLRLGCFDAENDWWFASDNVMMTAIPLTCQLGDANGDQLLDTRDISPFVMALLQPEQYEQQFPDINPLVTLDMNGDGRFNTQDIDGFIDLLLNR